ncbi:MAG: hypothetical protein H6698_07810 [Myxococcales bacterium]|nr:hypothetical protein [Myxococcales bacterium]MCB9521100.1 hypothetical protein [Myxococcales bacterium]MCB9534192.1 hypothetical protein [Myxococcales bacterium]
MKSGPVGRTLLFAATLAVGCGAPRVVDGPAASTEPSAVDEVNELLRAATSATSGGRAQLQHQLLQVRGRDLVAVLAEIAGDRERHPFHRQLAAWALGELGDDPPSGPQSPCTALAPLEQVEPVELRLVVATSLARCGDPGPLEVLATPALGVTGLKAAVTLALLDDQSAVEAIGELGRAVAGTQAAAYVDVALALLGDREALSRAEGLATEPGFDLVVALAMGRAGEAGAAPALETCVTRNPDPITRQACVATLRHLDPERGDAALRQATQDPSPRVSAWATAELGGR